MLSCTSLFLKSKYLYLSLVSSNDSLDFFISKGSTLTHSPSISKYLISISISPVFILGLTISGVLGLTVPVTVIVLSLVSLAYFSTSLLINCTIPVSSLTTIKTKLPKFLIESIQPATLTSFPIYSFVTSPQ